MRFKFSLLVILVLLFQPAYGRVELIPKEVVLLRWVHNAEPIKDAKKALRKYDFRLKAIYGLTLYIPGAVDNNITYYQKRFGIAPIEGTSDCILGEEHKLLVEKSTEYAKRYNQYILENYQRIHSPY